MNMREQIVDKLMAAGGFWSYDAASVREHISDEQLIEATLEKLDLEEIDLLFELFPAKKIKEVWRRTMVVQGDYYYSHAGGEAQGQSGEPCEATGSEASRTIGLGLRGNIAEVP